MPTIEAPIDDVIEIDEICVRQTPALWLWIAVSRKVKQVLGYCLDDRSDQSLIWLWQDVPITYQDKPVATDHWSAYQRFFATRREQIHQSYDKGSGQTSIAEGLNTKWRQRCSGLTRRACGIWTGVRDDVIERFMLLADRHNRDCIKAYQKAKQAQTLLSP